MENDPSIQSKIDSVGRMDGENLLVHQSWKNQVPAYALFIALESLVIYATLVVGESKIITVPGLSYSFSLSTLKLFPILVLVRVAFCVLNERLVITPTYMIHVIGRLWWRERTVRLEYGQVQEVEISQSILQKLLGVGDLALKPIGGNDRASIYMRGVRNPRLLKDVIRDLKSGTL